jgi:hypothetical protein
MFFSKIILKRVSGGEDATQPPPTRRGHGLFNIRYI